MKGIHIHHIRTLWRKRRGETKEETKDIKKETKTNERKRERGRKGGTSCDLLERIRVPSHKQTYSCPLAQAQDSTDPDRF